MTVRGLGRSKRPGHHPREIVSGDHAPGVGLLAQDDGQFALDMLGSVSIKYVGLKIVYGTPLR